MSGGDMYAAPSYEDVQKDVQAETEGRAEGRPAETEDSNMLGCLLAILVMLVLVVIVLRMLQ